MRDRQNFVKILPNARAISCMEKALEWPASHLRDIDQARAFGLVALARARDVSVEDIARRGRHHGVKAPSVWHELALEAADRIATGLKVKRVMVF